MKKSFITKHQKSLSQQSIYSLIKKAVEGISPKFEDNTIEQILLASKTENGSKFVINSLVNIIDQNADSDSAVFKALKVFYICLISESDHFRTYAKLFLPEISSILTLNFKVQNAKHRNALHQLSQQIYQNLAINSPLPSPSQLHLEKYVSSPALLKTESINKNLFQSSSETNETPKSADENIKHDQCDIDSSPPSNSQFVENLIEFDTPEERISLSSESTSNFDDEILFLPGLTQSKNTTNGIKRPPKSDPTAIVSKNLLGTKITPNLTCSADVFRNIEGCKAKSGPLITIDEYNFGISSAQSTSQILDLNSSFEEFGSQRTKEKNNDIQNSDLDFFYETNGNKINNINNNYENVDSYLKCENNSYDPNNSYLNPDKSNIEGIADHSEHNGNNSLQILPSSPPLQSHHANNDSDKDNINTTDYDDKFPLSNQISSDLPSDLNSTPSEILSQSQKDQYPFVRTSEEMQQQCFQDSDQSLNSFLENRRRSLSLDLLSGSFSLPSKTSQTPAIQNPSKVIRFPTSPTLKAHQSKANENSSDLIRSLNGDALDLLELDDSKDTSNINDNHNDSLSIIELANNFDNSSKEANILLNNIEIDTKKHAKSRNHSNGKKFNITKSSPNILETPLSPINALNQSNNDSSNILLSSNSINSAHINSIIIQPLADQPSIDELVSLPRSKTRSKTMDMFVTTPPSNSKDMNYIGNLSQAIDSSPLPSPSISNQFSNTRLVFQSPSESNIPIMGVRSNENTNCDSFVPVSMHQRSYSNTTPISQNRFSIIRTTPQNNKNNQDNIMSDNIIDDSYNTSNDNSELNSIVEDNIIQLVDTKPIATSLPYMIQQDEKDVGNSSLIPTSDSPLFSQKKKKKNSKIRSINIRIHVDDDSNNSDISTIPSSSFTQSSNESIRNFFSSSDQLIQTNQNHLQNNGMLPTIIEEGEDNQFEPLFESPENNGFDDNFELIPNEEEETKNNNNNLLDLELIPNDEEIKNDDKDIKDIESLDNNADVELIPISPREEDIKNQLNFDQFEAIDQNDTINQPSNTDMLESLKESSDTYDKFEKLNNNEKIYDQFEPILEDNDNLCQFEPIYEDKEIDNENNANMANNYSQDSELHINDFEPIDDNNKEYD